MNNLHPIMEDALKGFVPPKWEDDGCPTSPVALFAEAVAMTRMECHGLRITEIAKCFKAQFDAEELKVLIRELSITHPH